MQTALHKADDGNDYIVGDAGRDIVIAGPNNDTIFGGGADLVWFDEGDGIDRIVQFEDDIDTVQISDSLLHLLAEQTVEYKLSVYATEAPGRVVLKFSDDDWLIVKGISDAELLLNDIDNF